GGRRAPGAGRRRAACGVAWSVSQLRVAFAVRFRPRGRKRILRAPPRGRFRTCVRRRVVGFAPAGGVAWSVSQLRTAFAMRFRPRGRKRIVGAAVAWPLRCRRDESASR
ncbi:hypothetical protein, partial [Microbacterium bovistercoris]|uniref:hypothetical protein n=1 Tax=Microbacterium bovistercoris TaxID=2293570 RepID=UPI001C6EDB96